tara:strand:+ start:11255 stop:11764 length:510 start_codon:yes stop_codon:yes gene_type:complete
MQSLFDLTEQPVAGQQWQSDNLWEVLSRTRVDHELDVFDARRNTLQLAIEAEFSRPQAYHLLIAMTELGNNIVFHSCGGFLSLEARYACNASGQHRRIVALRVVAEDIGPGILNIDQAMQEGYSSINSMGCGLSGVCRLVDSVNIQSDSTGTRVEAVLWLDEQGRAMYG